MRYRAPAFVEIKMDAEIGSYQEDTGDDGGPLRNDVPFATAEELPRGPEAR